MATKTRYFSREVGPIPGVFVAQEQGVLKKTSANFVMFSEASPSVFLCLNQTKAQAQRRDKREIETVT